MLKRSVLKKWPVEGECDEGTRDLYTRHFWTCSLIRLDFFFFPFPDDAPGVGRKGLGDLRRH